MYPVYCIEVFICNAFLRENFNPQYFLELVCSFSIIGDQLSSVARAMSRVILYLVFLTRSDVKNQAVQLQKMARGLKLWVEGVEVLCIRMYQRLFVRSWILCIFCFHICVFVAIKIKFTPM